MTVCMSHILSRRTFRMLPHPLLFLSENRHMPVMQKKYFPGFP